MNTFRLACLTVPMLFFGFSHALAQTFAGQGNLPFPPGAPLQATGNTTSVAVVSGDGENADGAWQLLLADYVSLDVGTLNSWSISFAGNGTAPIANPAALQACGSGGQATFNLTSVESTVNGNTGNPVLWYTDMQATNPISNSAGQT